MEWNHLRSRAAVLCATAILHATVVAAFLQKLPLGVQLLAHPDAHSTEVPRSPPAVIVSLESSADRGELQGLASVDAVADYSLRSVSIDVPAPAPISVPSERPSDAARVQALDGSVEIRCEVHIHQSLQGQVQAIDFGACTGDAEWQRSLIQSIERAADLVQPSDGASFPPVRTLHVASDSVSPVLLARQLSAADSSASETDEAKLVPHEKRFDLNALSDR